MVGVHGHGGVCSLPGLTYIPRHMVSAPAVVLLCQRSAVRIYPFSGAHCENALVWTFYTSFLTESGCLVQQVETHF